MIGREPRSDKRKAHLPSSTACIEDAAFRGIGFQPVDSWNDRLEAYPTNSRDRALFVPRGRLLGGPCTSALQAF